MKLSAKMFNISIRTGFSIFFCLILISCKQDDPKVLSPYISDVFEYVYAPGQHAALAEAIDADNFIGDPANKEGWLYLGGFGGYVIAGFDHNVFNGFGADFEVFALPGASPEPAIVYVMADENEDRKPNDTWYELKGSLFSTSKRNYWVKYYKPVSVSDNIKWVDSEGSKGELTSLFGDSTTANWWWSYTIADSVVFKGTRLPDSYTNNSVTEIPNWTVVKGTFKWGYAENNSGTDFDVSMQANKFDISNAVDSLGNEIELPTIRFIKVQTAVFQQAGQLNEVSAEITGAKDLRESYEDL